MDYLKVYNNFIIDRRTKEKKLSASGQYFERHHITPKSLGGSDRRANIIKLTPEDHFFAHKLLALVYGGSMWTAIWYMSKSASTSAVGVRVSKRWYGIARRETFKLEHYKKFGERVSNSQKRIEQLKKYYQSTDTGEIVRERYKDEEYFSKWKKSCKESWTEERKQEVRERFKSLWQTDDYKQKMVERNKKPKDLVKISETMKALWQDKDFIKKMKGRKVSSTTFKKGIKAHNMKQVICLSTGEIFESAAAATRAKGYKAPNAVSAACRTKSIAYGCFWAYL